MKPGDPYHKWVEWSDADQAFLGKCPDLMTGIHGDDPLAVYADLCAGVDEIIAHIEAEGRRSRPRR